MSSIWTNGWTNISQPELKNKRPARDGGCQCDQFCGYTCSKLTKLTTSWTHSAAQVLFVNRIRDVTGALPKADVTTRHLTPLVCPLLFAHHLLLFLRCLRLCLHRLQQHACQVKLQHAHQHRVLQYHCGKSQLFIKIVVATAGKTHSRSERKREVVDQSFYSLSLFVWVLSVVVEGESSTRRKEGKTRNESNSHDCVSVTFILILITSRMDRIHLGPEETLCFISHHRGDAKGEARMLHTELSKCLNIDKKLIFIDVDALQDLDQLLRKHVGMTRVLVLLQTKDVLFRPFVLAEIYTALLDGIGVLTVNIANGGYDFTKASNLLGAKDFPRRLETANPGAVGALERQGIDVSQMGSILNDRIPNLVSVPFEMTWPEDIREAGIKHIGTRIIEMAQKVPPRVVKPAPVSEADRLRLMSKKLEERGISSEDAAQYTPRLVREGFTAENLVALARPHALKKAGITKYVHLCAILSEDQVKEMEAYEEANVIAEERMKLERTKMELNFAQQQIEASKAAADASINAATEEERRALLAKAEQIRKEAQEKAKRETAERLKREEKAKRETEEQLKREENERTEREASERVEAATVSIRASKII